MHSYPNVFVISHPLIQEHLTRARDRHTDSERFRNLIAQIAQLMAFELTRDYPTIDVDIETPMAPCLGKRLAVKLTLVPVLRAGLGMTDGILQLVTNARVGHLGIFRDHDTLAPVVYYCKLPADVAETDVIVIDPMLATGGSLNVALDAVKRAGASRIKILCLVASPEGIECVRQAHTEVPIYTAAIDERLDNNGYILPGLGDAGDRLFGTA
jgi:uracil phosphoribosyltransferase